MKSIVLFHSTNQAIWAEKVLSSKGIKCRMIAVPRELSSDCGYCLQYEDEEMEEVREIMTEQGIEYERIVENE